MISRLLQAAPWDARGRGSRGCGGKASHSCKKIISFAAYFPLLLQTVAVPEPRSAGHADSHAHPRCAPLKSPGLRAGVATPRRRLGCGKSGQKCVSSLPPFCWEGRAKASARRSHGESVSLAPVGSNRVNAVLGGHGCREAWGGWLEVQGVVCRLWVLQ